jgi:hypothetical protein
MRIGKLCFCLALVSLLGLNGRALAVIGTIDDVPAATLLLPYFEVACPRTTASAVNTLFSINNASDSAVLAHVTLWTDQSVPALDFDVYLTGYDVHTISLYDVLCLGHLPRTASSGQDPNGAAIGVGISPRGIVSDDINYTTCTNLPYGRPAVSESFRAHLNAWLQGKQSPATGNCAGSKTNDGILRGYVTVDTVNACNLFFPSDWAFYAPFITNQNVLWGDYFYVNPLGTAQGETLVHIEACPAEVINVTNGVGGTPILPPVELEPPCFLPGSHTFYGRYNGATAEDGREPLPTTMAARYLSGGAFPNGTDFLVWREADDSDSAYNCNLQGPPTWYPLEATQIVIFDEEEQPVTNETCPSGDPTCEQEITIPNEANRVDVATDLLAPFDFGWAWLNLQHTEVTPIYGDTAAQTWVTTLMEASGRYAVGFDAIQLDNANTPNTIIIPVQ